MVIAVPAALPMATLLVAPDSILSSAVSPTATLSVPVVLLRREYVPNAVLPAAVLQSSEWCPTAVLLFVVALVDRALVPKPVFLVPVVFACNACFPTRVV